MDHARIEEVLKDLVQQAGRAIMEVYESPDLGVQTKADDSPVTRADLAADRVIAAGLAAAFPDNVPLRRMEVQTRIDQLAEMAWTYGHRLDSIAKNVESFYALAADLPE